MKKLAAFLAVSGTPAFAHHGSDLAHSTSHAAPVLIGIAVAAVAAFAYLRRN